VVVFAPLVETQQYRSIRVEDLPEVLVRGGGPGQPEQLLVPRDAQGDVAHANDCPRALHSNLAVAGLRSRAFAWPRR
jgi:hypothetical protein